METLKIVVKSAHSDSSPAESNTSTTTGEEKSVTNDIAGALHYKSSTYRESQVRQRVCIRQNETTEHKTDWQKKIEISATFQAYCQPFASLLPEMQSMWSCHIKYTIFVEQRIEILCSVAALLQSAQYQGGPKLR